MSNQFINEEPEINIGSVVKHIEINQLMIVREIDGTNITCSWFVDDSLHIGIFNCFDLELMTDEKILEERLGKDISLIEQINKKYFSKYKHD